MNKRRSKRKRGKEKERRAKMKKMDEERKKGRQGKQDNRGIEARGVGSRPGGRT